MAQRNTEKRNQILRVAYDAVSLSYIAEKTGIKKSLLQHYYGHKGDITRTLFDELLSSSSFFLERFSYSEGEVFHEISDFNMLFFKTADRNQRLN